MKRVLVAANDPGGANAVLPVVQELIARGDVVLSLLTGPARDVFARADVACVDVEGKSLPELTDEITTFKPNVYLAGTSMGESIDKKILSLLQGTIKSIYVLDFWNNYSPRFSKEKNDFTYLPDYICVPDELAREDMLKEGFSDSVIKTTGNPYFEHFADQVQTIGEDSHKILFISQPVSEVGKDVYGFDEYDVMQDVVESFIALPIDYHLSIRLHPRDVPDKYTKFMRERIELSRELSVEEDLSSAGLVIGMFSPVLIQAAIAGKSVLSFEPNLTGLDPLPTNRTNVTHHAYSLAELKNALTVYLQGNKLSIRGSVKFADGAAETIASLVISSATNS